MIALADLTAWLDQERVPAMLIGGVAASLMGRPRMTRDIDALALIPHDKWAAVFSSAKNHGLTPRVEDPLDFARRTHVLLLRHEATKVDVDVILGGVPFEAEAVRRSRLRDVDGVQVRLPQVEDLMIMKAIAHRPKDLLDIEGLLDAHPNANTDEVRQWVREFATAMTMPDVLEDFDRLLARRNELARDDPTRDDPTR